MKRFRDRKVWVSVGILMLAGAILAFLARRGQSVSPMVMLADVLFSQASAVTAYGLWLQLLNVHMFTSFTYSFRNLHKLRRGTQMKSSAMKEDFLQYRESRKHHDEAAAILMIGAVLIVIAVIASFTAV